MHKENICDGEAKTSTTSKVVVKRGGGRGRGRMGVMGFINVYVIWKKYIKVLYIHAENIRLTLKHRLCVLERVASQFNYLYPVESLYWVFPIWGRGRRKIGGGWGGGVEGPPWDFNNPIVTCLTYFDQFYCHYLAVIYSVNINQYTHHHSLPYH